MSCHSTTSRSPVKAFETIVRKGSLLTLGVASIEIVADDHLPYRSGDYTVNAAAIPLALAASYLIGAIPFGLLVVRLVKGVDIRDVGSGSIGATNVGRLLGKPGFIGVFILDFCKGFGPVAAAQWYARQHGWSSPVPPPWVIACGLAAILGHVFPIYLKLRGGKAVATSAGVFTWLAPWAFLIALVTWVTFFGVWRYVSLASIVAAVAILVGVCLTTQAPWGQGIYLTGFTLLIAILVIARHKENIRRLLKGEENPFGKVKRDS